MVRLFLVILQNLLWIKEAWKKMKIIGSFVGNVDCKRFYMPGIKAFSVCPNCKREHEIDFIEQYLSYPVVNRFQNIYFYCEPCNENWEEEAMLEVKLSGRQS